jgi:hypothetical protein
MNRSLSFFLLSVVLLALLPACSSKNWEEIAYPKTYSEEAIVVSLHPTEDKYHLDEAVPIRFTITNYSEKVVRIPRVYSPLEGEFSTDYLFISQKRHRVFYKAQRVQRLPYLNLNRVKLKPGESISQLVDIQEGYALEKGGKYRVQFIGSKVNRLPDSAPIEIKIKK